jgi:hypothetical protein
LNKLASISLKVFSTFSAHFLPLNDFHFLSTQLSSPLVHALKFFPNFSAGTMCSHSIVFHLLSIFLDEDEYQQEV